jgi:hypothetical protein
MKILFVGRSVGHLSYYSSLIRELLSEGHHLRLIFDQQWSKQSDKKYLQQLLNENENLTYSWLVRRDTKFRDLFFFLRELRTYCWYLSRADQSQYYTRRWLGYFSAKLGRILNASVVKVILRTSIIRFILKLIVKSIRPDKKIQKELEVLKPDCIFVSPMNMRFDEEVEYALAAKKLKIPVNLIVLSWDNLTTKGLFHADFDVAYAWNFRQLEELASLHKVDRRKIVISGAMFFDKWFTTQMQHLCRSEFLRKICMNKNDKYLLYIGSSKNIAKDESWVISLLLEKLKERNSACISKIKILVRPHPANFDIYNMIKSNDILVYPEKGSLPEFDDQESDIVNSMKHAELVVGLNTSAFIDSIIMDKPTFSIAIDEYIQTQSGAQHFQQLVNEDVIYLVSTFDGLIDGIERVMLGEDPKKSLRHDFVKTFIWPNDTPASKYISSNIKVI